MFKNIKEYEGIPVQIKRGVNKNGNKKILASYSKITKSITIYEPFYKQSIIEQKAALEHEVGHHILLVVAPLIVRKIWIIISIGKLIPLLNTLGITGYTENAFARKYGSKNWKEDFSTCVGELKRQEIKGVRKFNNFVDIKLFLVKTILNKYR